MSKNCCCTDEEEKIITASHGNHEGHSNEDGHDQSHDTGDKTTFQLFLPAIIAFVVLAIGLVLDHVIKPVWFTEIPRFIVYAIAYIPVGFPVLREAFESIKSGNWFSEFFLMGIATIGAFAIGEYPEGVAVMLFYTIGEIFQALLHTMSNCQQDSVDKCKVIHSLQFAPTLIEEGIKLSTTELEAIR